MERINIGDMVCIKYSELLSDYYGVVNHVPQDVGDMWYIETEKEIMAINPNCSILIGIFKEK